MSDRSAQAPDHDELRDDLAAYALGALEVDEAERLRGHLETCEGCRRQLRRLTEAVELLPRMVEQLEPPWRLRRSLMETVRGESRQAAREPLRRSAERWWPDFGGSLLRPATVVAVAATLVVGVVAGYLVHDPGDDGSSLFEAQAMGRAKDATGTLEHPTSRPLLSAPLQ